MWFGFQKDLSFFHEADIMEQGQGVDPQDEVARGSKERMDTHLSCMQGLDLQKAIVVR